MQAESFDGTQTSELAIVDSGRPSGAKWLGQRQEISEVQAAAPQSGLLQ